MNDEEADLLTLAQDTYSRGDGVGVVKDITADESRDLAEAGWTYVKPEEGTESQFNSESGFKAALYKNEKTGNYVLSYSGTDLFSKKDWDENTSQAFGNTPTQYKEASALASQMKDKYGDSLSFTGHSLGGGLASFAASETGLKATTFNASGLHPNNRNEIYKNNISAIVLTGDILNVQQDKGALPDSFGIRKSIGNPLANIMGGLYGALRHGAFDKMKDLLRSGKYDN